MSTTFELSPSVQGAIEALATRTSVSATDLALEILKNHTEYGAQDGSAVKSLFDSIKKSQEISLAQDTIPDKSADATHSVPDWIESISRLYNPSIVKVIHGRLAIVGLCLVDKELEDVLIKDGFIFKVIKEIKEHLKDILSEHGLKLYNETLAQEDETAVTDFVNNQGDGPLEDRNDDKLDRHNFAEFLVKLLDNTDTHDSGAYSLHLYAPWGAGKTSVMNFMKKIMDGETTTKGKKSWYAIDFNAWQNQSLAYPWWSLMNSVYIKIRSRLSLKRKINEWWWRFSSAKLHYLIALVVITWLVVLFIIPALRNAEPSPPKSTKDSVVVSKNRSAADIAKDSVIAQNKDLTKPVKEVFENIDKIIAALISAWAFVAGLSRSIFLGSKKTAQNYVDSQEDPLNKFKERFGALVDAVTPSRIAIFIDDLDRCKSPYVVELLESIQTLFKCADVVFIIAADKKWIHACYEVEYEKIKQFVGVEGKAIGPLFVEKMFQLSVSLPGIDDHVKEKLWESMIGIEEKKKTFDKASFAEIKNVSSVPAREKFLDEANKKSFDENHAIRLEILGCLADKVTLKKTESFLKPYSKFMDMNPRSMKRLLNSYSVNKASSLISHIDIPLHQLILWTILLMRWPGLAEYLAEHPEVIDKGPHPEIEIPKNIGSLLKDREVDSVIKSKYSGEPLTVDTLKKCRELFMQ